MNIEIANRLVQYRKTRGLSQEGLAAELGLSRQAVSKWERAEASPDTDNLIALARLYGVSIDALLLSGEVPEAPPHVCIPDTESPTAADLVPMEPLRDETSEYDQSRDTPHSHYEQLSPGAKAVLTLGGLIIALIFFIAYAILCRIFPGLVDAYAPICTAIYLLLGFVFHLWHPGWLVFLTIPILHSFF